MQYDQYRFKFYFNASHAIYLNGRLGQPHPHTWELILHTAKIGDNFVPFNEIEKMIDDFLYQYQDEYLNGVRPFTTINPTLENICTYFKGEIQKMLYDKGWLLLSIELSETPTRAYVISVADEVQLGKQLNREIEEIEEVKMQDIVDRLASEKLNIMLSNLEAAASAEPENVGDGSSKKH